MILTVMNKNDKTAFTKHMLYETTNVWYSFSTFLINV